MSLSASIGLTLNISAATTQDFGTAVHEIIQSLALASLSTGSGLNQANYVFADRRSLNASTAENIDMYAPAVRDALGQTLTLSKVKALYIHNRGGSTLSASDIVAVGGEGSAATWNSPFSGSDSFEMSLEPDGKLVLISPSAAGYAVANTTNHLLKVENLNGAQAITYDIIIIGS